MAEVKPGLLEVLPSSAIARDGSTRPLRVAWLGHRSLKAGDGLITYSRETVACLRAYGVDVRVFHFEPELTDDPSVLLDAYTRSHRFVLPKMGSTQRLRAALEQAQVDLVHVSLSWSTLDFSLPAICAQLGLPLVATFHVPYDSRRSIWQLLSAGVYRLFWRTLRQCSAVIVFGGRQRFILESLGVPSDGIHEIPNGVDTSKYVPRPRLELGFQASRRVFAYVGRLDPEKNVRMLLSAFIAADPPSTVKLVVVGDGVERRSLERQFRDPRVVFTGLITDERERISILQSSEAFFLPSRVEGLSLSMLEAMACGNAVVASDVGNDGTALRGAGIVLDPNHLEEELRLAVRLLLDNPELARNLGQQARDRVLDRYSLASNVDDLVGLYERTIDRAAPSVGPAADTRTGERVDAA